MIYLREKRSGNFELSNKEEATIKFKTGSTYQMTFVTDSNLKPEFVCIKRTEKTVTFSDKHETITRRIKELDGIE